MPDESKEKVLKDKQEAKINKKVEKAIVKELDEKINTGGFRKETVAENIFSDAPGEDRLNKKVREEAINTAVSGALNEVREGTYSNKKEYREAINARLNEPVELQYTYVADKEPARKKEKGESKEDYQTYKEGYKAYEGEFKKLSKEEKTVEACHTVTLSEKIPDLAALVDKDMKKDLVNSGINKAGGYIKDKTGIDIKDAIEKGKDVKDAIEKSEEEPSAPEKPSYTPPIPKNPFQKSGGFSPKK